MNFSREIRSILPFIQVPQNCRDRRPVREIAQVIELPPIAADVNAIFEFGNQSLIAGLCLCNKLLTGTVLA